MLSIGAGNNAECSDIDFFGCGCSTSYNYKGKNKTFWPENTALLTSISTKRGLASFILPYNVASIHRIMCN